MQALAVAASLALAACAGGGKGDGSGSGGEEARAEAELAFARCMRKNGVELPDPGTSRDGGTVIRLGDGVAPTRLRTAERRCGRHLREAVGEVSQEDQQRLRDAALRFARCMRSNGVDVPDPGPGGGLIEVGPGPGAGSGGGPGDGPDPRSPRFRAAEEKCRDLLPRPPAGGGADFERSAP